LKRAARRRVALLFLQRKEKAMEGKLVRLRAYEKSDLDAVMNGSTTNHALP
jgi:hypothetical protein